MKKATDGSAHSMKKWNRWKFLTVEFKAFRQVFIAREQLDLHCKCHAWSASSLCFLRVCLPGLRANLETGLVSGLEDSFVEKHQEESPPALLQEQLLNRGPCPWSIAELHCGSITFMSHLAMLIWTWTPTHRRTCRRDLTPASSLWAFLVTWPLELTWLLSPGLSCSALSAALDQSWLSPLTAPSQKTWLLTPPKLNKYWDEIMSYGQDSRFMVVSERVL